MDDTSDFETGKNLFFEGRYREAEVFFNLVLEQDLNDSDKSDVLNALGAVFFKQQNLEKALDCFNHALILRPDNKKSYENKHKLLLKYQKHLEKDLNDSDKYEISFGKIIETTEKDHQILQNKKTCNFCGIAASQDSWLLFRCNYCGGHYCADHRLPPYHGCAKIEHWKARPPPGLNIRYQQNGAVLSTGGVSEHQDFSGSDESRFHQYYVPNHYPNEKYEDKSREGLYIALIIVIVLVAAFLFQVM